MTKHRISLILTISFASILLISLIILSILQTNTSINLPNPDKIKIYKLSTTASNTYSKGSDEYNEVLALYNNMFEKTYLEQLADNNILSSTINEDPNKEPWADANYETGVFIEFTYDSAKKLIINRDGNTRRVDVTSVIIQLTKNDKSEQVSVFYKVPKETTSSSNSNKKEQQTEKEKCYPLITYANTYELYKYVTTAK